ncbi:MAG: FAD-dependent oxidoreductase [Planctomycetes bacterium]|nr:FAD-dependent oxidoreductase [Planctomycetota bacterium]
MKNLKTPLQQSGINVPISGQSLKTTAENKTGIWRNVEPFYLDRISPCAQVCLSGHDIPVIIELVYENKFEEALKILRLANPLPASTGRVCPAPCESSCLRKSLGGSVSIKQIERFLGDFAIENRIFCLSKGPHRGRIAIIGAGPAGISAAYFLAIKGYFVTVFEEKKKAGGLLRYGIPSFRLPKRILDRELEIVFKQLPVEFIYEKRITKDYEKLLRQFDSVIITCGKSISQIPDIPGAGEKMSGLTFLEQINNGDSQPLSGSVAVIGGGSTAFDCARSALRLGCDSTIYYRRSKKEMPAFEHDITEGLEEGIQIVENVIPIQIDKNGDYKITFAKTTSKDRKSAVKIIPNSEFAVTTDHILFATGEKQEHLFNKVQKETGGIDVSQTYRTSDPKLFAAGDVTVMAPGTVAGAILQGRLTATSVHNYLNKTTEPHPAKIPHLRGAKDDGTTIEKINLNYFQELRRSAQKATDIKSRLKNFDEISSTLNENSVAWEVKRCFSCGTCVYCSNCMNYCPDNAISFDSSKKRFSVNLDYCKGCLICVKECPRHCMGSKYAAA